MYNEYNTAGKTTVYGLNSFIESEVNNKKYTQQCIKYIYITPLEYLLFRIRFVDIVYMNKHELQKHDDFLRRLSYRYNHITLSTNSDGELKTIENPEELRTQWGEIKSLLIQDYTGDDMESVLERISQELDSSENTLKELSQYNWLGLIFSGTRYIQQANDEAKVCHYPVRTLHGIIDIRENITKTNQNEESTFYKLIGQPVLNATPDYELIQYEGEIEIQNSTNRISEVNLDIKLKVNDTTRTEQYELYLIDNPNLY